MNDADKQFFHIQNVINANNYKLIHKAIFAEHSHFGHKTLSDDDLEKIKQLGIDHKCRRSLTHDDVISEACKWADACTQEEAVNAFIIGLNHDHIRLRSILRAYSLLKHCHKHEFRAHTTPEYRYLSCQECGTDELKDWNPISAAYFVAVGGTTGVDSDLYRAAKTMQWFSEQKKEKPKKEDWQRFLDMLKIISEMPEKSTANKCIQAC